MLSSNEIRNMFVEFFKNNGHTFVAGASLVPPPDSTLLFTNAGMNQFVDIFKGISEAKYPRVVNYQRCMRVSGKHNDLMEVGVDTTHHTMFEMLGNWSFADYGKKEAILWAWEFLTEWCKLPKEKLWVTVFREDDEAEELWKAQTDVKPSRIHRLDEKENFWEMGETGPCGPCSEIHLDLRDTPDESQGLPSEEYLIELWNLVFIQYERQQDGSLEPLKNLCVDTGMGLERLVSVLQGKQSNYDTDLFRPIIQSMEEKCGHKYNESDEQKRIAFRVISDHIRALAFLIADGIMPSNDGRGYVLRKVLRRSVLHGRNLGFDDPFLASLVPSIMEVMQDAYPELKENQEVIQKVVTTEEERFHTILQSGLKALDEEMTAIDTKDGILPGDVAFRMSDTYGVPIDFIEEEIAPARGLKVDRAGYEQRMQEQRERARQAQKGKDGGEIDHLLRELNKTTFIGYECLEEESKMITLLKGKEKTDSLKEGEEGAIVLETTPFYAESGGQIGDRGSIITHDGFFAVTDTQATANGVVLHYGCVKSGTITVAAMAQAKVHPDHRTHTAYHHTATHLMNYALRKVLGNHVKQSGSLVTPEYMRFDFTHYEAMRPEEIKQVEEIVNHCIRNNYPVSTKVVPIEKAKEEGALAFFGDKYSDIVRVVGIHDFSKELCGGTHVSRTGDIGVFFIQREGAISTGVRRIEAVAGQAAYRRACHALELLRDLQNRLNVSEAELTKNIDRLLEERKQLTAQNQKLMREAGRSQLQTALSSSVEVNGVDVITLDIGNVDGNAAPVLRDLGDDIVLRNNPKAVAVLAARAKGRVNFVVRAGKEAVEHGIDCNQLIRQVAKKAGGSGGGRKDMAQGGAPNASQLKDALDATPNFVKELVTKS